MNFQCEGEKNASEQYGKSRTRLNTKSQNKWNIKKKIQTEEHFQNKILQPCKIFKIHV